MSIRGAFGHFKTITKHRHAVIRHCKKEIAYNENLLLDGLKAIYEKNR